MALSSWLRLVGVAAMPIAAASCTNSLELDRFHKGVAANVDTAIGVNYFDVRFSARGMISHIGEHFEVRLVDKDNRLQAKAVYDDIVGPDFSLYLARIVPKANSPYRLDFWADHNNTAKYDGIEGGINDKDHAWRRVMADPLPDDMRLLNGRYELDFVHDTAFVDIATDLQGNKVSFDDTLLPFELDITNADAYRDLTSEVRVVDKASGRLIGLYRQGRTNPTTTAKITGVLDEETPYEISVYVDANRNGKYDLADPSWKLDAQSSARDLVVALDVSTTATTVIETGEP